MKEGKLQSLGAVETKGEVFVSGRVKPEDLRAVLGISRLRVIMTSHRLAYLILLECHKEDHRHDIRDCLARSRTICWIPRAHSLARSIINGCLVCKREEKKLEQQVMGVLPSFKSPTLAPFTACGVDLMGPYQVHEKKSRKVKHKVWAVCYTCFSSKACCFILTSGYAAEDFLRAHSRFTNTYGAVSLCVVDRGTNLLAAAFRPDWGKVAEVVGMSGTRWLVVPKAAAWRAGQAERHIGMCKRILHRLLRGVAFNGTFEEMEALLSRCSWILNSRPLAVRTFTETDFALLCPNDILLGRASRGAPPPVELGDMEDVTISSSLTHMEKVARGFYRAMVKETFPEMVPRRKWRWQERNLRPGDVGFLCYPSKFGKPWFRPCRVLEAHPDLMGTVRTVTVGFRTRRGASGKVRGDYSPAPLETMVIPVQRMSVMLPAEDQQGSEEVRPGSFKVVQPEDQEELQELTQELVGHAEEAGRVEKCLEQGASASLRRSPRLQGLAGVLRSLFMCRLAQPEVTDNEDV